MAPRALTAAALMGGLVMCGTGCSGDDGAAAGPTDVTIPEVELQLHVPGSLADLTYAMGLSEEGQPAVYFSSDRLATVGGPSCAAGASESVSPYPLGQIVISDETPRHVRKEARDNPEENLGRFVRRVDADYIYYVAPPLEPCAPDDKDAAALQRQLTGQLRDALSTLRPADQP